MHLDFAVVADYAIVDQAGKLSVLGIFQHIWVQQFPAMHPRLHLVLRLKGKRTEVGEHHVQIRLVDEQNAEVLGGTGNVAFAEPPAGVTARPGEREAHLAWQPPARFVDGSAAAGPLAYEVLRAPAADAELTPVATAAPGRLALTDRGLENERTYSYAIRAVRTEGETTA